MNPTLRPVGTEFEAVGEETPTYRTVNRWRVIEHVFVDGIWHESITLLRSETQPKRIPAPSERK
jgi:hypothetical protein